MQNDHLPERRESAAHIERLITGQKNLNERIDGHADQLQDLNTKVDILAGSMASVKKDTSFIVEIAEAGRGVYKVAKWLTEIVAKFAIPLGAVVWGWHALMNYLRSIGWA